MAAIVVLGAGLGGCASESGRGLIPGQSTESQVEALMGPSTEVRKNGSGETVRYYSRLQYGRQVYAARFGVDGRLIALEERMTEENVAKIKPGWGASEVRDLLGPPYRVTRFPLLDTEVWEYKMKRPVFYARDVQVGFSRDGRVTAVQTLDDGPHPD